MCMFSLFSHVCLFVNPWTVAPQAPQSMGFSRQEYWSEFLVPSPGNLPDPGIEPGSPALQTDSLLSEPASCIIHVSINPRSEGAKYATGEEWRSNPRKNKEMEPKRKHHPDVYVKCDGNKVQC